jgi:hypothetical protein
MSYDDNEKSIDKGEPFEVYELLTPSGPFRYASGPQRRRVDNEWYEGATVTRSSIVISSILDSPQTMDFNFPVNNALTKMYMGRVTPDTLRVRVLKGHANTDYNTDFSIEWVGDAVGYSVKGDWFVVETVSRLQAMISNASAQIYMQNSCNNTVYDERCQANPGPNTHVTQVTAFDNLRINVQNQLFASGELNLGTMEIDRTGEIRTITSSTANVIGVAYPFNDIKVGDSVTLIKGCDNKMSTCHVRFNNVAHYNGFRFVPVENPFQSS